MIDIGDVKFLGEGLCRPECVLYHPDGSLHVADWRGGVSVIKTGQTVSTTLCDDKFELKPNGIAILDGEDGWLVAHLGENTGGVYNLNKAGQLTPFLLEIDGEALPPTNYVHVDFVGRVWVTVSTRLIPRIRGCNPINADGFIILIDKSGARIVADGLGFTNECLVHPHLNRLYVNETFGRRLSFFEIKEDGSLSDKRVLCDFEYGEYPDGLTFDVEGCVWVTSIVSNKVIRVNTRGQKEIILEDSNETYVNRVEEAYSSCRLKREHLDNPVSNVLKNISSLAFGGSDLRTVFLGCLQGTTIPTFRSNVAGLKPSHWSPAKWNDIRLS